MSCGIGMIEVQGDAAKLVSALETKHRIYVALMRHSEYTGIRITASVYTTVEEIDYFAESVKKELAFV
jgi:selenocysteine lyase/cysteine desulfurase